MNESTVVAFGDARGYTPTEWLKYGDIPNPNTRQKMIMLGIEQIIRVGVADFVSTQVCERLGIKHPMVNHYFGSRAQFMAEVQWWAYQHWARNVDGLFRNAPAHPRKRLRAFVEGEVEYAKRLGGMAILIQYPTVSASTLSLLTEQHQAEAQRIFEYHLALITLCVRDIRNKTVSPFDFDVHSVPKSKLLKSPRDFLCATEISWATHGLAMWSSGKHLATEKVDEGAISGLTTQIAVKKMIDTIVSLAER